MFRYIHFLLIEKDSRVCRFCFHVFSCACPTLISSIFGKSFHFPFPYFVLFIFRYFPFHVVYIRGISLLQEVMKFPNLRILYLHGNNINDQSGVRKLSALKNLFSVTFHGQSSSLILIYNVFLFLTCALIPWRA